MLSNLSKTPPCPGKRVPLSFAPTFRLSKLELGTRKTPRVIEGTLMRDEPHSTFSELSIVLGSRKVAASVCAGAAVRIHFGFRFGREKWAHGHTHVDLSLLTRGLSDIDGWFHMHTVSAKNDALLGQVKLSVRPSNSLCRLNPSSIDVGQRPLSSKYLALRRSDGQPYESIGELLGAWEGSRINRCPSPSPDPFDAAIDRIIAKK